jgi:hypothetical protein
MPKILDPRIKFFTLNTLFRRFGKFSNAAAGLFRFAAKNYPDFKRPGPGVCFQIAAVRDAPLPENLPARAIDLIGNFRRVNSFCRCFCGPPRDPGGRAGRNSPGGAGLNLCPD